MIIKSRDGWTAVRVNSTHYDCNIMHTRATDCSVLTEGKENMVRTTTRRLVTKKYGEDKPQTPRHKVWSRTSSLIYLCFLCTSKGKHTTSVHLTTIPLVLYMEDQHTSSLEGLLHEIERDMVGWKFIERKLFRAPFSLLNADSERIEIEKWWAMILEVLGDPLHSSYRYQRPVRSYPESARDLQGNA